MGRVLGLGPPANQALAAGLKAVKVKGWQGGRRRPTLLINISNKDVTRQWAVH
jgi:hypothetical protein